MDGGGEGWCTSGLHNELQLGASACECHCSCSWCGVYTARAWVRDQRACSIGSRGFLVQAGSLPWPSLPRALVCASACVLGRRRAEVARQVRDAGRARSALDRRPAALVAPRVACWGRGLQAWAGWEGSARSPSSSGGRARPGRVEIADGEPDGGKQKLKRTGPVQRLDLRFECGKRRSTLHRRVEHRRTARGE